MNIVPSARRHHRHRDHVPHPDSTPDQQIIFGLLILVVVAGYGRGLRLRDRI